MAPVKPAQASMLDPEGYSLASMAEQTESTTALAPYEEPTDTRRQYFTGDVQFEAEEVLKPKLRLAQGLTEEVQNGTASPGDFVLNGYDPEKQVTLIPMLVARSRDLRDMEDENSPILCQSGDAVVGVGNPGGACKACPMASWNTLPDGKRLPPPCTLSYSYVCWSVTHGAAVTIDFRKTSITIAHFINAQIQTKGFGHFGIVLSSRSQKGKRGSFSVPQAVMARLDEGEFEVARAMLASDIGPVPEAALPSELPF